MDTITIIGSGPSAVHFALSVLLKGYQVKMLDVGFKKDPVISPELNFNQIKRSIKNAVHYFLGEGYESVTLPSDETVYYGFPPSKKYIFTGVAQFNYEAVGFKPLISFAQGGLAEAWTAGAYPFNDDDLKKFPISYEELAGCYGEVAKRIGISGKFDELARFYPFHKNIMPALELDNHSKMILDSYSKKQKHLNLKLGTYLGRSRLATLSKNKGSRDSCCYSGRCHWGCPTQSLYTPSSTLEECNKLPNFEYIGRKYVKYFDYDNSNKISAVIAEDVDTMKIHRYRVDSLVLAAGTLSSTKIFLDSIFQKTGKIFKLRGLMDNRQIWAPFLNLRMIGKKYEPDSYQYHQIVIGLDGKQPEEYVHGLITTLKTALIHPLIQNIPLSLGTSSYLFRDLHAALGMVNVNFHDYRRKENYLTLTTKSKISNSTLKIVYSPPQDEDERITKTLKRLRMALGALGCIAPSIMQEKRPMGASVHYAGTIPMSDTKQRLTTSENCKSHDFRNLHIVDGTTFPFLPAKNLTLTLMANAVRVAEMEF